MSEDCNTFINDMLANAKNELCAMLSNNSKLTQQNKIKSLKKLANTFSEIAQILDTSEYLANLTTRIKANAGTLFPTSLIKICKYIDNYNCTEETHNTKTAISKEIRFRHNYEICLSYCMLDDGSYVNNTLLTFIDIQKSIFVICNIDNENNTVPTCREKYNKSTCNLKQYLQLIRDTVNAHRVDDISMLYFLMTLVDEHDKNIAQKLLSHIKIL